MPMDKFPATGIAPVKPVVLYETVPAPVAPMERLPFIVNGLPPVVDVSARFPEVLSKLRFPKVCAEIDMLVAKVELPR